MHNHGGITTISTCAVNRVHPAQNGCRQRTTAFDKAITANDTSESAVNRDYIHLSMNSR